MKATKDKYIPVQLFLDYDTQPGASGLIIQWDGSDKAKDLFISDN